jgi:hypothetical protein
MMVRYWPPIHERFRNEVVDGLHLSSILLGRQDRRWRFWILQSIVTPLLRNLRRKRPR